MIDWKEMSNSEIEVKLKELEFEYEKIKTEISTLYNKLEDLNSNYIIGNELINKRKNLLKIT